MFFRLRQKQISNCFLLCHSFEILKNKSVYDFVNYRFFRIFSPLAFNFNRKFISIPFRNPFHSIPRPLFLIHYFCIRPFESRGKRIVPPTPSFFFLPNGAETKSSIQIATTTPSSFVYP